MRVYLAEKPRQGRDIAQALGGGRPSGKFALEVRDGMVVWARGHLVELAPPEDYDPGWTWGRTGLASAPFVPKAFRKRVVKGCEAQVKEVCRWLAKAAEIVICTDPEREGELIARELILHAGARGRILRLWLGTVNEEGMRKALAGLREGRETEGLWAAGELRERSDWLLGMNGTIVLTELCGTPGTPPVTVGRVQTPTLALVVGREEAIERFRPEATFRIGAQVQAGGHEVAMQHRPDPVLKDRAAAEALARRAEGAEGPVRVAQTERSQAPPRPFSLGTLQQRMSRIAGWTAQHTLDVAQRCYETHKALSYPRTSGEAYAEDEWGPCVEALSAVSRIWPEIAAAVGPREGWRPRKGVWSDARLAKEAKGGAIAHNALRPTADAEPGRAQAWGADDRLLMQEVSMRFAAQICSDWRYGETRMAFDANGVAFTASGRVTRSEGWRALLRPARAPKEEGEGEVEEEAERSLPPIADATAGRLAGARLIEGVTKAPPRFKDGPLVAEMGRLGLGTEASQAGIIETLRRRGYCSAGARGVLVPTVGGRALVAMLAEHAPGLVGAEATARLERELAQLAAGERRDAAGIQQRLFAHTVETVEALKGAPLPRLPARTPAAAPPKAAGARRTGRKGAPRRKGRR